MMAVWRCSALAVRCDTGGVTRVELRSEQPGAQKALLC